jgi:hypothetical protein
MDNRLERYKQIRKIGMEIVNKKITKFIADNYSKQLVIESAKKLGMLEGKNTIAVGDEDDIQYIFDFVINEIKINGKSGIELFKESINIQNEIEHEFIGAIENSYTSLFRVVNTSPDKGLVFIKNLLGDGKNIRLTDIGLSQMKNKDTLLFTRIMPFKDMNITSGIACPFDSNYEMKLMTLYEYHMKNINNNESEERFVFFYNEFKINGMGIAMQEV